MGSKKTTVGEGKTIPPLPESSKTMRAMQAIQTERGGEEIDVRKQTDKRSQKEKHFSLETKAASATCVSLCRGSKHSRRSPARLSLGGGGGGCDASAPDETKRREEIAS